MFCFRSVLVVAAACVSILATAASVEQVVVVAIYQDHVLQFTKAPGRVVSRQDAGAYFEWVNEREFLLHAHLVEGATYIVEADVQRIEVHQFPDGWGARSKRPYSTYYLYAKSATRSESKK